MPTTEAKMSTEPFIEESDVPYEEEILHHPFQVKCWMRYIAHKKSSAKASPAAVNMIYERALKQLPGSYKLWYNYLKMRRQQVRSKPVTEPGYEAVNNAFERSLVFMHKMPRIWLDFCQFLMDQCWVTRTRHSFNRALKALPVTQHHRVWPLYLRFVRTHDLPETAMRVYRNYLKIAPEDREDYIEYLISIDKLDEAAIIMVDIVNDDSFISKKGKSTYGLWHELCELIAKNPDKITTLKVDAIIRGGLHRFKDMIGQLWVSLGDYYIRAGHFESARDVYEEAMATVTTVRDFSQVFDAFAQFEESMLNARLEASTQDGFTADDDLDLDMRLARIEHLMECRPLLLNSVLLRQNPHNVFEWHKRVELFEGKPREIINTYTEAVKTVDTKQAVGKVHTLWVAFANFYEENDQVPEARLIFEKAIKAPYRSVDELADVWCKWGEMELRHEHYGQALRVMERATTPPARRAGYFDTSEAVQSRVYRSLKVWALYADLESSLGTFESAQAVYYRILDLKIATPQIIINFALFLEENTFFEEAFKVYERGVSLFKWPQVFDIWNTYLTKFIQRYQGTKLERLRELFEQCVENCPPKYAKSLYLLYAKLEEDHGLARHAMAVYDRATKAVLPEEQFEMFSLYLSRASDMFGVTNTRKIYAKAIEQLADEGARSMCQKYAALEAKLGEIDRARVIFVHGSQMSDPRIAKSFWSGWQEFEVRHGNEDTFREMLRVKRSVQAKFNTQVNFMSTQMLAAASGFTSDINPTELGAGVDEMALLEERAKKIAEDAKKDLPKPKSTMTFVKSSGGNEDLEDLVKAENNPDEIELDEEGEEHGEDIEEVQLVEQSIPTKVFGGISEEATSNVLGAKARFSQKTAESQDH